MRQSAAAPVETVRVEKRSAAAGMMGVAAAVPPKVYTGSAIIGIGVAHKSCLVPVFSIEHAQDLSKMRRG
jgi:hypothetical protein